MTPYGYRPDLYHCLLDEQPYYLVPPRLLRPDSGDTLLVNPSCWFAWRDPPPRGVVPPRLTEGSFVPVDNVVWVLNPSVGSVWPYWVGADTMAWLAQLVPGRPVPPSLPPHLRWVLANAQILVPGDHATRVRRQWLYERSFRQADLRRGFVVVPNLVPPLHLGALRRYYRYKTRTSSFVLRDDRVGRRYTAHDEAVAGYVLEQLARAVSEIAGATVRPSRVDFVAYQSGARVEHQREQEQWEYSVTLLIDSAPEPGEQSPWPIQLDTRERTIGVWQYLGEALLYRGRRLSRRSDALPAGCASSSLLMHYAKQGRSDSLS